MNHKSGLPPELAQFLIAEFGLTKETEWVKWTLTGLPVWNIMKPMPPMSIFNDAGEIDITPSPVMPKIEYTSLTPKLYSNGRGLRILAVYDSESNRLYYQWK